MNERRRHPRQPLRILVKHGEEPDGPFDIDYATDVSHSGLFISTARSLPKNATFHVQFSPTRDSRVVSGFCRVTRLAPDGFGAEFLDLDVESRSIMQAALR